MKYQFVKFGDKYIVKNSNGRIVSEKEKIQMENHELILKDITGCGCQKETTKKLSANKKRLKEIEKKEKIENYIKAKVKDDADDIIQETTETL